MLIAGHNGTRYPGHVFSSQEPARIKRRIDGTLIPWHTALEIQREGVDPCSNVIGDHGNKLIGVGFRIELGAKTVFEGTVDHPRIHQEPFGLRTRIRQLPIDQPACPGNFDDR